LLFLFSPVVYPGYVVAQGTVTCGLPGKKQTLAANLSGTLVGTGAMALSVK
jgi:hypothetical protein